MGICVTDSCYSQLSNIFICLELTCFRFECMTVVKLITYYNRLKLEHSQPFILRMNSIYFVIADALPSY